MNEELLLKLYDKYGLSTKGSFDQFKTDMGNPEVQRKIYDKYLTGKGTFEQFQTDLGGKQITQQPEQISSPQTEEQPGFWNTLSQFPSALGKQLKSFVTDQTPITVAQGAEVVKSAVNPTNPEEFVKLQRPREFQQYVRERDPKYSGVSGFFTPFDIDEASSKYAQQFMKDNGLYKQIGFEDRDLPAQMKQMEEKLPEVIERRVALEKFVAQQKKQSEEKLKGVTQDIRDVHDLSTALSVAGNFVGQAVAQIPLSFITKGGSSYLMEIATVYDSQLDELAQKNGISREEVIRRNLDSPALNQQYAMLAASLDAASAGSILGAVREGAKKGFAKEAMKDVLGEMTTEVAQGNIERFASKNAAGVEFDPLTSENLWASANEAVAAFLGSGSISAAKSIPSGIRNLKGKQQEVDQMIQSTTSGDPQLDTEIDLEAEITPTQQQIIKESEITKALEEDAQSVRSNEGQVPEGGTPAQESQSESSSNLQQQTQEPSSDTQEQVTSFEQTPEYIEADTKVREIADQIRQNPNEDALFSQLNEAKQARDNARIAFEQKSVKPTRVSREKVTLPISQAIKAQFDAVTRGLKEGVQIGQQQMKDLVVKAQEVMKDYPLSDKQRSAILTRVKNTNPNAFGTARNSIMNLNLFIDRVSKDAEYADKLDQAKQLNKQLRKASKNELLPRNIRPVIKAFASINPEDTFINEHLDHAKVLLGLSSQAGSKNYLPSSVTPIEEYVSKKQNELEETQEKELKQKVTPKTRQQLEQTLSSSLSNLQSKDLSEFDESEKRQIESIKNLDPTKLGEKALRQAIYAVDNIVHNDNFTATGKVKSMGEAVSRINRLVELFKEIKAKRINQFVGQVRERAGLSKDLTRSSVAAAKMDTILGINEYHAAEARAEIRVIDATNAWEKVFKRFKRKANKGVLKYAPGGVNINDPLQLAVLNQFSILVKRKKGASVEEVNAGIEEVHKVIEQTIASFKKASTSFFDATKYQTLAVAWENAHNTFKDAKTIEDVYAALKRDYPYHTDVFNHFLELHRPLNEPLRNITEEYYNKTYTEYDDYTPTRQIDLNPSFAKGKDLTAEEFSGKATLRPTQATTTLEYSQKLHGNGWAIDPDFLGTQFSKYGESVRAIETTEARANIMNIFDALHREELSEMMGGEDNVKVLYDRVDASVKLGSAGRIPPVSKSHPLIKVLSMFASVLRTIGVSRALGTFVQIPLQTVPILLKSGVHHVFSKKGSPVALLSGMRMALRPSENLRKLFDQHQIGLAGRNLGVLDRGTSTSSYLHQKSTRGFMRFVEGFANTLNTNTNSVLGLAIIRPDTFAKRSTWISYYLQSLKSQGVENVDMNKEYLAQDEITRKNAAAFAEQMVQETQTAANPKEASDFSRPTGDEAVEILKQLAAPFSRFPLSAKSRYFLNMKSVFTNPNMDNGSAVLGDLAEIMMYSYLATYALRPVLKEHLDELFREFMEVEPPEEEDEEEKLRKKERRFWANVITQISPVHVGEVGEYGGNMFMNHAMYAIEDTDGEITYEEWKKEKGSLVYDGEFEGTGVFGLGWQPPVSSLENASNLYQVYLGDGTFTYKTDFVFDQAGKIEPTEEEKRLMRWNQLVEMASTAGINEATVFNSWRKVYKEKMKEARKETKSGQR